MKNANFYYEKETIVNRSDIYDRYVVYKAYGDKIIGLYFNNDLIDSDYYCFTVSYGNDDVIVSFTNPHRIEDPQLDAEIKILITDFSAVRDHPDTDLEVFEWFEYELHQQDLLSVPYGGPYEDYSYQDQFVKLPENLRNQIEGIFDDNRYDELFPLFRKLKFQAIQAELS